MLVTNVNLHAETKEALKTCFITGLGHSGPMMQLPGMGDRPHPGTHKRPEHEVEVGTCSDDFADTRGPTMVLREASRWIIVDGGMMPEIE